MRQSRNHSLKKKVQNEATLSKAPIDRSMPYSQAVASYRPTHDLHRHRKNTELARLLKDRLALWLFVHTVSALYSTYRASRLLYGAAAPMTESL